MLQWNPEAAGLEHPSSLVVPAGVQRWGLYRLQPAATPPQAVPGESPWTLPREAGKAAGQGRESQSACKRVHLDVGSALSQGPSHKPAGHSRGCHSQHTAQALSPDASPKLKGPERSPRLHSSQQGIWEPSQSGPGAVAPAQSPRPTPAVQAMSPRQGHHPSSTVSFPWLMTSGNPSAVATH